MTVAALPALLDGQHLIETFGIAGLMVIMFAETGLLIGFFLPGDSILFAAGYAATGKLSSSLHPNIAVVCLGVTAMAIAGAQTGFLIGQRLGPVMFDREDSRLFKRSYVTKAEGVIERYGVGRAIVLARFVPIVRTFLNPLVGAGGLSARVFFVWNVVGGVLWGTGITLLGYFLGNVEVIGKNLELFAVIVVAISVSPIAFELLRHRRKSTS